MKEERIFCFGRPIIDISATIREEFLREVNIDENLQGEISKEKMENLLRQLSKKADYVITSAGGVESNVAINSAILGIPSSIVGTIGNDYLHLIFKDSLGFIGKLDFSLMPVVFFNSAVIAVIWIIKHSGEKKRIKVLNYGVSEYLPWDTSIKNSLQSATTIFFTSLFTANTPQTESKWREAVRTAKKFDKKVIINLGGIDTIPKDKLRELVDVVKRYAEIIFMNEQEWGLLHKHDNREVCLIFPKTEFIVITKGKRGSSIFHQGKEISIVMPKERNLNRTGQVFEIGAGDAFCAGYIFAISKGAKMEQAAEFATEVSLIKIKYPESNLAKARFSDLEGLKSINFQ